MKKEDKKRRLSLSRETIQMLDDPRLLEQVRGGTSQVRFCTSVSYNQNEISTEGC